MSQLRHGGRNSRRATALLCSIAGLLFMGNARIVHAQGTSLSVSDYSFENGTITNAAPNNYVYAPSGGGTISGSSWLYGTNAGISGNGSGFTSSNPVAPDGKQVCFLQWAGTVSESVSGFVAGTTYDIVVSAAQRATGNNGGQTFKIEVDNNPIATITPSSSSYSDYYGSFTSSTTGSHTIAFVATDPLGGNNTAFIDNIRISSAVTLAQNEAWVDTTSTWSDSPTPLTSLYAGTSYWGHVGVTNATTNVWYWSNFDRLDTLNYAVPGCGVWSIDHAELPTGTVVLPGQAAIFNFPVHAPAASGTYPFQWQMEGPDVGTGQPTITVTAPPYDSSFVSGFAGFPVSSTNILSGNVTLVDVPTQMYAGQQYDVTAAVANTGTTTWQPGLGVMIGLVTSTGTQDSTWGVTSTFAGQTFNAVQIPNDIAPEDPALALGRYNAHFVVTAPSTAGTYNLQVQPMQVVSGSASFFATPSHAVPVTVVNPSSTTNNASYVGQLTPPSTVHGGQNYNVSLTFTNTGTATWSTAQKYKLASYNPVDNSVWGVARVNVPESVPPGGSVSFNFVVTAPAYNPGGNNVYNYQWTMLQECAGDFGATSPNVQITVTS